MSIRKFIEFVTLEKHVLLGSDLSIWVEIKDVSCIIEKLQELYTETRSGDKYDVLVPLVMTLDTMCEAVNINLNDLHFERLMTTKEDFSKLLYEIDEMAHIQIT